MHRLKATPLSAAAFAPYGDVVAFEPERARLVNGGRAWRADTAARLSGQNGAPVLAIFRSEQQVLPLRVEIFERHPCSSQAFVAVTATRFLVVVAPPDDQGLPNLEGACAFVGSAGEGVNYRRDVWHAPIVSLDREGDFMMMMWESGSDEDCIVHRPSQTILVDV